jgi:hypothetical protein
MNKPQFTVESNDMIDIDTDSLQVEALLAAIIAIERDHPGFMLWCVRTAALANAGFRLTARTSNVGASLRAQEELKDWLDWYSKEILHVNQGGDDDVLI